MSRVADEVSLAAGVDAGPGLPTPRAIVQRARDAVADDQPDFAQRLLDVRDRAFALSVAPRLPGPDTLGDAGVLLRGLAASRGVGTGAAVFDVRTACELSREGPVVLFGDAAESEDVAGFRAAQAVVTTSGGITSNAAVIARGLGVPAVVGACEGWLDGRRLLRGRGGEPWLNEGEIVTVDGDRGIVYVGAVAAFVAPTCEVLAGLFRDIRKLRPRPLWIEAQASVALAARDAFTLDGVFCRWSAEAHAALHPDLRPRDAWLLLPANLPTDALRALPPGWGFVLDYPEDPAEIARVRSVLRGRAVGVHASSAEAARFSGCRLDVFVGEGAFVAGDVDWSSVAARVMWRVAGAAHEPLPAEVGVVAPIANVGITALTLAGHRPNQRPLATSHDSA